MKRIDIMYGGEHYSVGGRDLEALREEITTALTSGVHWLEVNDGEGAPRTAFLLLSPGTPIAVIPLPDDAAEGADLESWEGDEAPT